MGAILITSFIITLIVAILATFFLTLYFDRSKDLAASIFGNKNTTTTTTAVRLSHPK